MMNCKNCGVRLDEHMNFCPVCGVTVVSVENQETLLREREISTLKLKNEIGQLNRKEKRKFYWEVISIILGAGIISTLVLNFIINKTLNWSLYVSVGGLTIFAFTSAFAFLKNTTLLLVSGFIISAFTLVALDIINTTLEWSYQLGIPLLIASWVILSLLLIIFRNTTEKGFNLIAYTFLALGILIMVVQLIISGFNDKPQMDWSLIIFFSIIPVVTVLLYFHYKLRKGTDLRKFFHI